jgi:hypothetical protein
MPRVKPKHRKNKRLIKAQNTIGVYKYRLKVQDAEARPDFCFYFTYHNRGKMVWKRAGRLSEGYTEEIVAELRGRVIEALRAEEQASAQPNRIITDARGRPFAVIMSYANYLSFNKE